MYWSYLCRNTGLQPKLLTFEYGDNFESLKFGYCELVLDEYFSCFSSEYDFIFISKYNPNNFPYYKEKDFVIRFDELEKAKKLLVNMK